MPNYDPEYFQKMLKEHDWTYMYSDDHRYWVKGSEEMKKIQAYIKEHGQVAKDLYIVYYEKIFGKLDKEEENGTQKN